jgi:DNA-binding GntR family transcriptional regulator
MVTQLAGIERIIEVAQWERLSAIPNTRIPTESELVEVFEVARTTALRAVAALRDEGILYTVAQRGTYVTLTK